MEGKGFISSTGRRWMAAADRCWAASRAIVWPGSVRCQNCNPVPLRFSFDLIMFLPIFMGVLFTLAPILATWDLSHHLNPRQLLKCSDRSAGSCSFSLPPASPSSCISHLFFGFHTWLNDIMREFPPAFHNQASHQRSMPQFSPRICQEEFQFILQRMLSPTFQSAIDRD